MEWVHIIINVLLILLIWLFFEFYFPSYMKQKGKNLATKEDIQEITRKTEEVQREFKEGFESFTSDLQFKYDFYYKQYSELYSKLYAIIIQSEYVRHFLSLTRDFKQDFNEVPFIEINYKSIANKIFPDIHIQTGEGLKDNISKFNKIQLCNYIINHGEYATQKLLKLAVSYRYAYSHYAGNEENPNSPYKVIANDEELRLIREMVCCIVSEYNYFRKELKMNYNEEELDKGIPLLKEN